MNKTATFQHMLHKNCGSQQNYLKDEDFNLTVDEMNNFSSVMKTTNDNFRIGFPLNVTNNNNSMVTNDYWHRRRNQQSVESIDPHILMKKKLSDQSYSSANSNHHNIDMFWETLSKTLSFAYAVFIITFGLMIYLDDLMFTDKSKASPYPEMFCIYLLVTGLVYFIFLYVDLKIHLSQCNSNKDIITTSTTACHQHHNHFPPEQKLHYPYTLPRAALVWRSSPPTIDYLQHQNSHSDSCCHFSDDRGDKYGKKTVNHSYCFSLEHHSSGGSYLKLGIAGFCMGHLLHSCLLLSYEIVFFLENANSRSLKCARPINLILDLLYPSYSFVMMFFIFKYSNVIISRFKGLARFAVMHCIGANLSFWLWTILRELMESMNSHGSKHVAHIQSTAFRALPLPIYFEYPDDGSGGKDAHFCRNATDFSKQFESFTPYLCPFTVEFSILMVAVLYEFWSNIGKCVGDPMRCHTEAHHYNTIHDNSHNVDGDNDNVNDNNNHQAHGGDSLITYPDCHASNKGLFAGFIVLVGCFLSIILFFVSMAANSQYTIAINAITECILLIVMTAAVPFAYRQTIKLDERKNRPILLDCVLLFVSKPALFIESTLSIGSLMMHSLWQLATFSSLLKVVQVLLQTPFIIDGLQRCSNSKKLRHEKPGRELITLLIICNISFWILDVFEIKSQFTRQDLRSQYYGYIFWTIMGHLSMPLIMFYRFHSSVCLVDIWKGAYQAG